MEDLAVVALGCLLHDIGKIVQRADDTPLRQGHSRFGADLIQSAGLLKESKYWSLVFESIRYHHAKYIEERAHSQLSARIACEADKFVAETTARDAAGFPLEETEYPTEIKWERHRKLDSVFALLQTANGKEPARAYFPLALLEGRRITLQRCPHPEETKIEDRAPECYSHMRDLAVSPIVAYLQGRDPRSALLVNDVSRYLENHLSFVPAECVTDEPCYISLFDHMSLSAATGSAIYLWLKEMHPEALIGENKELPDKGTLENSPLFLILTARVQGARRFIFEGGCHAQARDRSTAKTAMCGPPAMKARARYVDLFREWMAEQFLRACGLTRNNLLLSSGNQFFLLLPNTPQTLAMAARMQVRANEWLLETLGGLMHLVLDCTEVNDNDLRVQHDVKSNHKSLFELTAEKMQSSKEPYRGMLKSVFAERKPHRQCSMCGQDRLPTDVNPDSVHCLVCVAVTTVDSVATEFDSMLEAPYRLSGTATTTGAFPIWNQASAKFETGALSLSRDDDALLVATPRGLPSPIRTTVIFGPFAVMHARITQPPGSEKVSAALKHSFQRELILKRYIERFVRNYIDEFKAERDPAPFARIERIICSPEDLVFTGPADKLIDFAIQFQQRLHKFSSGTLTLSCGVAVTRDANRRYALQKLAIRAEELDRITNSGMCVDFDTESPGSSHVQAVNWHDWRREVRPLMHDLQRLKSRNTAAAPLWNKMLNFVLGSTSGSFYQLLYTVARVDERAPDLQADPLWQRFKRHRLLPLGSRNSDPRQRQILAAALLWVELTRKTNHSNPVSSADSNAEVLDPAADVEPPMMAEEEPDTLTVGGG
ncbi:MAG: HD domain-containing protein [Candidatus Obscuribacterales bacterium]|nr:HD domain-containing protein [Candidatus Obscuribacterales bacterium]